jgi:hypothetical protein
VIRGAIAALAFLLWSGGAWPDDVTSDLQCRFRHKISEIDRLEAMPAPILGFLRAHLSDGAGTPLMAARGEEFDATDTVSESDHHSARRFIRAGQAGNLWFVWYEHGGLAYQKQIIVFAIAKGAKARVVAHRIYFRENPCLLTDDIIDGRPITVTDPQNY